MKPSNMIEIVQFICSGCGKRSLSPVVDEKMKCKHCKEKYVRKDGVWQAERFLMIDEKGTKMKPVEEMTHEELVARYKAGNPFAVKAAHARAKAIRFLRPSAHEAAMAQSFPLGAGFGRPGGERRIEASVNKAVNTCEAIENAKHYESKAQAFDEGRVNAQGRQIDKFSVERSIKREEQKARREQKINKAKAECEGKAAWQVTGEVWAIAHGYLSGGAHELVAGEHTEIVKKAIDEGKPVPPAVLEWYKGKVPDANPI